MTRPDQVRLLAALETTWPAAGYIKHGAWTLRKGLGGGKRVSAATSATAVTDLQISEAETGMLGLDQAPLFMITDADQHDTLLEARGYDIVEPVTLYLAKTDALTGPLAVTAAIASWPPLAVQNEIWAKGGITAPRVAVMERVSCPKTGILGRFGDLPAGSAFVACDDGIGFLHALEVIADQRRNGVGRNLVTAAANWAMAEGAEWLALAVTTANLAANQLYQSLGMTPAGFYHYRRAPESAK